MSTMIDRFKPGQTVPEPGIYGLYFLGEYMADARVLSAGERFPAAAEGVAYRLHEAL
ncbi:hypothetical protein [Microbacterium stercoris]|uniref:Uncharacterized protein n=1 Tax=Microbacterium stercoris TaxID=2820289 RepID=A0A939QUA3_9MICO|nr:hypothetical protein [Microbacterium stercoris]MBO3664796.1 hypothetical protein [Microbacterium stercoris]